MGEGRRGMITIIVVFFELFAVNYGPDDSTGCPELDIKMQKIDVISLHA